MAANDGQTLAQQPVQVQRDFAAANGSNAEGAWEAEHNAAIGAGTTIGGDPNVVSGTALGLQISAATQAANAAFQQAEAAHLSRDDAINAARQAADAAFQTGQLGQDTLKLLASMGGPASAFTQQAVLHGLNAAGLSRAVDAISGKYGLPTFQAPQANPQVRSISDLLGTGNNATTGVGPGPAATGQSAGPTADQMNQRQATWDSFFGPYSAGYGNENTSATGALRALLGQDVFVNWRNNTVDPSAGDLRSVVDAMKQNYLATGQWGTLPTNFDLKGALKSQFQHDVPRADAPTAPAAPTTITTPAPLTAPGNPAPSGIQWKQVNGQWEGTGTPTGPLGTQGATFNIEGGSGAAPVNPFDNPGGTNIFGGTHIHLPTNAAGGAATLDPTTAAYINALPPPNQINAPQWQSLDKDTQDFLKAAYQQAGYSANDIDSAVAAGLPQFKAPNAALVGASGQLTG